MGNNSESRQNTLESRRATLLGLSERACVDHLLSLLSRQQLLIEAQALDNAGLRADNNLLRQLVDRVMTQPNATGQPQAVCRGCKTLFMPVKWHKTLCAGCRQAVSRRAMAKAQVVSPNNKKSLLKRGVPMRVLAILTAVVLGTASLQATDCTSPIPVKGGVMGVTGQMVVPMPISVPTGYVWLLQSVGLVTTDGRMLEYMLQHHVLFDETVCCFYVPLMRLTGSSAGTPILALNRTVVLEHGETLSGRVNGPADYATMGINYKGWAFPAACLPQLLGIH